jgi:hypothetical protein
LGVSVAFSAEEKGFEFTDLGAESFDRRVGVLPRDEIVPLQRIAYFASQKAIDDIDRVRQASHFLMDVNDG